MLTNTTAIEQAIAQQDLHTEALHSAQDQPIAHDCIQGIWTVVKQPKQFPKVEYRPCVTIIDNRNKS